MHTATGRSTVCGFMKNYIKNKTYLILLADRKRVKLYTLLHDSVSPLSEFIKNDVPQKVKHGDDTWDAQDKINRHIEEHLHQHLKFVSILVKDYVLKNPIDGILLGGHKDMFEKLKNHLPFPLSKKVIGNFVTELKVPLNTISKKALLEIERLERKNLQKEVNAM